MMILGLTGFSIFMIIAVSVLGIGWIAYGIYDWRWKMEEKKNPKKARSEKYNKAQDDMTEYAKKMKEFKKKTYKREDVQ